MAKNYPNLRTRTPQGDGNTRRFEDPAAVIDDLRTRTPQGDGNVKIGKYSKVTVKDLRTRTPQGDGNLCARLQRCPREEDHCHLRTRTPQGDGNSAAYAYTAITVADLRTRTPQGDGNFVFRLCYLYRQLSFKNQNPARGRKRCPASGTIRLFLGKFKNQNPARGRKPIHRKRHILRHEHLRTRTPQGDGNFVVVRCFHLNQPNLRTRTPQGDGNSSLP